jgi:hypothetical protein
MIKKLIISLLILVALNYSAQNNKAIMPEVFYRCWTASFEEDAESANVFETYRPCDFKNFKVAMFRRRMEFFKNGKCKWLQLAANDAHYFIECVWIYKRGKIFIKNEKEETLFKFKIEHLAHNRMNIVGID